MDQQLVIVALITFLSTTFILTLIGGGIFLRYHLWNKKNNIDIIVFDLYRSGIKVRKEKGHKVYTDNGWNIITSKWLSSKIKDQLGYNITEDHMELSTKKNRKYLFVAMKNGFSSSLEYAAEQLKLSDEELILLKKCEKQFNIPGVIKLDGVPKTLTLNPLIQNQTRFAINHAKDQAKLYNDEDKKHLRRMQMMAMGIVALALIIAVVILVIAINQAPTFAGQITANAAKTTTASIVPGLPTP